MTHYKNCRYGMDDHGTYGVVHVFSLFKITRRYPPHSWTGLPEPPKEDTVQSLIGANT